MGLQVGKHGADAVNSAVHQTEHQSQFCRRHRRCRKHSAKLTVSKLVGIPGLRKTFIKRYTVERTNKAELRPEEQSEKAELSGEFTELNTVKWAIKTETDTRVE